ncbi:hypothetical protein WDW37_10970 [Bdellovibrionota bacterium FG-1]
MLKTEALRYKGNPDIAAIKLVKALLEYKQESDYECTPVDPTTGVGGALKNQSIAKILTWFASYGDLPGADRVLFAKLASAILHDRKICPLDRNLLLAAMQNWKQGAAPVQYQLICSTAANLGSEPFSGQSTFSDVLLIANIIGIRTPLSESAWIEQIRAFGDIRGTKTEEFSRGGIEENIHIGLLKYALGFPAGVLKAGATDLKISAEDAKPGKIVHLCRILFGASNTDDASLLASTRLWLQTLRTHLTQPRPWPATFSRSDGGRLPLAATLTQEFASAGLAEDLKAIESNCAELPPAPPHKLKTRAVPPAGSTGARHRDFNPAGRR